MSVAQFLSAMDLYLPCKCLNMQVGGQMWASKSWKCYPKLLNIFALESNCAPWKDILSIDHTQQESFLDMGHFSKNLMAFYLSKVPKLVPLEMHLSEWCKQCCEITVKWDAVTDALLNPKKQIDSPFIDSVISPWLSSLQLWVDGFILLCLKHRAMEKISIFFFFSPHGNTGSVIIKILLYVRGELFLFSLLCFAYYSEIYICPALCMLVSFRAQRYLMGSQVTGLHFSHGPVVLIRIILLIRI